mgnify:CR=1 FL=1
MEDLPGNNPGGNPGGNDENLSVPGWEDPDDTPGWFWSSISNAINSAISGLLEVLFTPFNLIGTALDSIGEGISRIGNTIWSFFSQPLTDIWNAIKSIPGDIMNMFRELLTSLFVPSDGYFINKFNNIKILLDSKFGNVGQEIEGLKNVTSTDIQDIKSYYMGCNVKFVDFSWLNSVKSTIHNIARGFIYPLLVLFHLDNIIFLIRGKHFFRGGKDDN